MAVETLISFLLGVVQVSSLVTMRLCCLRGSRRYISTGRPFETLDTFQVQSAPQLLRDIKKMNPETVVSPFVLLDANVAINRVLNGSFKHNIVDEADLSKYDYSLAVKTNEDDFYDFNDDISNIIKWEEKYNQTTYEHILPGKSPSFDIVQSLKEDILETFKSNDYSLSESINFLSSKYSNLSLESVTMFYFKVIPQIGETEKIEMIKQAFGFFNDNILHFHDHTIVDICQTLLFTDNVKLVASIVQAYNKFSQSDFFKIVPIDFLKLYLDKMIESGDVTESRQIINKIISENYTPGLETLTKYFMLADASCQKVNVPKIKKEMIFIVLTQELKEVLLKESMINDKIIASIVNYVRINNIDLFIKYLQKSPEYYNITNIPDIIFKRIENSSTYQRKSNIQKAVFLSSIIDLLNFDRSKISDQCKHNLINLYSDASSPLAVLYWSGLLTKALSGEEKSKILDQLKKESTEEDLDITEKL